MMATAWFRLNEIYLRAMEDVRYVLGVDLGTTAVKVCLVDERTKKKILQRSQPTKASLSSLSSELFNEQCPEKILLALQYCLSTIENDLLNHVSKISICGQMHGVILWKKTACHYELEKERFRFNSGSLSTLITWQDRRCTTDFLESLPERSSVSFSKVSSGYGCASMFWLLKHGLLSQDYECAGTISDLIVAMLTDSEKPPIMTSHNADSFGYYNPDSNTWDIEALASADFPCYLLPEVTREVKEAGKLKYFWCGIPARTPVYVAFGDTQCSAFPALSGKQDAALLNMGTSAQLTFICDKREFPCDGNYTYFPFFEGKYLCVAPSLNGGNILSHFVATLSHWLQDLNVPLPESQIWDRLLHPRSNENPSFEVKPQLFGERHNPDLKGSVLGLSPALPSLDMTFKATCAGLIENIVLNLPVKHLRKNNIKSLVCCGKVINHNCVLRKEVERVFSELTVEFGSECESVYGAALAVLR